MNKYLDQAKVWYEKRPLREQLLFLLLCWAFLYAFFSLFLFLSLDYKKTLLQAEITETKGQLTSWNAKMSALQQIAETPLYKKWLGERRSFMSLEQQYKYLLKTSSSKQWQDVIKALLRTQNNITLLEIKNSPESTYNHTNLDNESVTIYQQQLMLTIYANYFDTINYLNQLETILPNIHWDKLNYQVVQYPVGKIEMEFSILYEKTT